MGLSIGVLKETLARRAARGDHSQSDRRADEGGRGSIGSRPGAGLEAGFPDEEYTAQRREDRAQPPMTFARHAQILLHGARARSPTAREEGPDRHRLVRSAERSRSCRAQYAQAGATLFSMELIPRITRAQSMDALSSMASIAGYKAVLLAASALPRLFPMMTTAAGTIPPARVLVIGAGVAGLQAIATARRLGAVVSGYDVRAAVKEQIESLGAKFVSITIGAERRRRRAATPAL